MKTRNLILSVMAAVCSFAAVSCSDMLDIPQKGVLDYNTYYKTDDQILSADVAMYLEVRGWEYNVKLCKAMLTDDFSLRSDHITRFCRQELLEKRLEMPFSNKAYTCRILFVRNRQPVFFCYSTNFLFCFVSDREYSVFQLIGMQHIQEI